MNDLSGKRLLLLGGHALMCHIINKARQLGIYTIVTDYVPNAPAKKLADKSYDISTLDVEALVELAQKEKVDGVFTGYVDVNLVPCRKVCDRLGLPFYATLEQLEQTMNKVNFKQNCRNYGLCVVNDVPMEYLDGKYDKVKYPVIVKPADSYSSKGISVCHQKEEMSLAIKKALSNSNVKQIVVEQYIDAEDVYLYFTIQNGILSLSAMADRLLNDEQYGCAPQPVGYFFPSKYINLYYEKVHDKLQKMMNELKIENGSFFMQGFVINEEIVFFEMGLRLSGGAGYLQIAKQNEIDQVEMHIRYSLTGKFDGWDLRKYDNARFLNPACVLVVLLNDGTIKKIEGIEAIMEHPVVFDIVRFKYEGDVIDARGTLNQVFARIYMTSENKKNLTEAIAFVKHYLKITDTNGKNMILNLFDEKNI